MKLKWFHLLLLFCTNLHAQAPSFRHFTTEDGLPSNTVYKIYCDNNGYLWMSTDKGVVRYDGFSFKTFSTFDGLPDNEVFTVTSDGEGRLWFASFSGELCFYKAGVFHTARNTPWMKLPFKPSSSTMLDKEKDGSITMILERQKRAINIVRNQVHFISLEPFDPNQDKIVSLYKESATRYRVALQRSACLIDTNGNILRRLPYKTPGEVFSTISGHDTILIRGSKGIYSLDGQLMIPSKLLFDTIACSLFHLTPDNVLLSGHPYMHGLHIGDSMVILKDHYLTSIQQDHSGNYWFATRGSGVYSLNKYLLDIKKYEQPYTSKILYALQNPSGLLFVNNEGRSFRLPGNQQKEQKIIPLNKVPMSDVVRTKGNFIALDDGRLLVVESYIERLHWVLYQNGQKTIDQLGANIGYLKDIIRADDELYLIFISNICRISLQDVYKGNFNKIDTLLQGTDWNSRIYSKALEPATRKLWINRLDGMFRLDGKRLIPVPAFHDINFRQFTFIGSYLVGYNDKNQLLISNKYDGKAIITYARQQNAIWDCIYPVDSSRAIITSSGYYYLLTLFPSAGNPRYTLQALENPYIPQGADYIAPGPAKCYFLKNGMVTEVATRALFATTPPPIPVFSEIRTKTQKYPFAKTIHITYNESSSINILFDNISFLAKDITCEYSISKDGEDSWHEITGNEINLNTPGFGSYQIKVRAKTLSSSYSPATVLNLVIEKPFWATWWFIIISSLIFILLIWLIIQFFSWRKIRKKQKQHEADMKFQQSEYKALNALMNPHFIFNSLNNIQGLINKDEKRTANQYLVIFSDMIRQNMHNISKGFISLQQELDLIENYLNLEKLRFKELVNYKIIVEEEVETEDIMIPPLMIQPLVENAIKHGLLPKQSTNGMVRIHVYEKNNLLYIEIEDNGVGITYAKKHHSRLQESFSLSNMQQRAEHLKKIQKQDINIEIKELTDEYGAVKGTMALVTMELE